MPSYLWSNYLPVLSGPMHSALWKLPEMPSPGPGVRLTPWNIYAHHLQIRLSLPQPVDFPAMVLTTGSTSLYMLLIIPTALLHLPGIAHCILLGTKHILKKSCLSHVASKQMHHICIRRSEWQKSWFFTHRRWRASQKTVFVQRHLWDVPTLANECTGDDSTGPHHVPKD